MPGGDDGSVETLPFLTTTRPPSTVDSPTFKVAGGDNSSFDSISLLRPPAETGLGASIRPPPVEGVTRPVGPPAPRPDAAFVEPPPSALGVAPTVPAPNRPPVINLDSVPGGGGSVPGDVRVQLGGGPAPPGVQVRPAGLGPDGVPLVGRPLVDGGGVVPARPVPSVVEPRPAGSVVDSRPLVDGGGVVPARPGPSVVDSRPAGSVVDSWPGAGRVVSSDRPSGVEPAGVVERPVRVDAAGGGGRGQGGGESVVSGRPPVGAGQSGLRELNLARPDVELRPLRSVPDQLDGAPSRFERGVGEPHAVRGGSGGRSVEARLQQQLDDLAGSPPGVSVPGGKGPRGDGTGGVVGEPATSVGSNRLSSVDSLPVGDRPGLVGDGGRTGTGVGSDRSVDVSVGSRDGVPRVGEPGVGPDGDLWVKRADGWFEARGDGSLRLDGERGVVVEVGAGSRAVFDRSGRPNLVVSSDGTGHFRNLAGEWTTATR